MFISLIDKHVKMSLLKLIISWNTTSPFSSILYDSRFTVLLLVAIIGNANLADGKYDRRLMRFIQGK